MRCVGLLDDGDGKISSKPSSVMAASCSGGAAPATMALTGLRARVHRERLGAARDCGEPILTEVKRSPVPSGFTYCPEILILRSSI
jgi:hypothetical protein